LRGDDVALCVATVALQHIHDILTQFVSNFFGERWMDETKPAQRQQAKKNFANLMPTIP
jgi:hypothetical protein